jgi:hypothetical protein
MRNYIPGQALWTKCIQSPADDTSQGYAETVCFISHKKALSTPHQIDGVRGRIKPRVCVRVKMQHQSLRKCQCANRNSTMRNSRTQEHSVAFLISIMLYILVFMARYVGSRHL